MGTPQVVHMDAYLSAFEDEVGNRLTLEYHLTIGPAALDKLLRRLPNP